jgi:mannose-6-phosphate isomerase-like protein (cupin superfamily)
LPVGTVNSILRIMTDFVLKRWQLEPFAGDQAPPHIHDASDEAFCVISGNLEVLVGDERRLLHQGDYVEIPAGTVHTFATVGDESVTMLAVMTTEINDLITTLHQATTEDERSSAWATFRSRLA